MLRRVFNDQQLKTHLATHDLSKEAKFREMSVEVEAGSYVMHSNLAHVLQCLSEIDDTQNFNFKNRSVKDAYNARVAAQQAVNEEDKEETHKADEVPIIRLAPVTYEPPGTPAEDVDIQM